RSEEIAARTRRVLDEYVPSRLGETRSALDREDRPATFTVEELLLHVCTHELRHQGQIQAMLRLLGRPAAPNLDWI
ncbi:MAG TPA: DinB family protein, partial [Candidatus Eisenbacteria bacterium]|nr:DinB family protein [Candidatus Eisenbacteria bacterium]